jgi:hypothetical protein
MKIIQTTAVLFLTFLAVGQAQVPLNQNVPDPPQRAIRTGSNARDGFFVRDTHVFMVRDGVTTRVDREILFPNGIRVQPNGTVTMKDGTERVLIPNQWLDLEGSIDDTVAQAPTGIEKTTATRVTRESGVSARDGITVSGADVFITRNGVTEKVLVDTKLPNGVVVSPNGSVLLRNGTRVTLRAEQILDLDGVLHEAPIAPNPAAASGVSPSANPPQ